MQTKQVYEQHEHLQFWNKTQKGDEMPADYLSRHPIDDLEEFHDTLYLNCKETLCAKKSNFFLKTANTPHIVLNNKKF